MAIIYFFYHICVGRITDGKLHITSLLGKFLDAKEKECQMSSVEAICGLPQRGTPPHSVAEKSWY